MLASSSWSNEYPLQEKLKEVKGLSKIPIGNVQDVYNTLTDKEILNKVVEQVLEDKEYQIHRDELVNLLMGLKYKIKIEDLTLYDQFLHQIYKKVNAPFVKNLLIFIVLSIVITSGYVSQLDIA